MASRLPAIVIVVCMLLALVGYRCQCHLRATVALSVCCRRPHACGMINVLVTKKRENERKAHQVDTGQRCPCLPISFSSHIWHWLPTVVDVVRVLLALAGYRCQRHLRAAGPCPFIVVVHMCVASSIKVLVTKKRENERKAHQIDTGHCHPCPPISFLSHLWRRLPAVVDVIHVLLALAGCRC